MGEITYEWCVEEMDGDDIVETDFYEPGKLSDAISRLKELDPAQRSLCLYARTWDRHGEMTNQEWAYVEGGVLQPHLYLAGGSKFGLPQRKVPQRFLNEFKKEN
jgi:hypothetical protein